MTNLRRRSVFSLISLGIIIFPQLAATSFDINYASLRYNGKHSQEECIRVFDGKMAKISTQLQSDQWPKLSKVINEVTQKFLSCMQATEWNKENERVIPQSRMSDISTQAIEEMENFMLEPEYKSVSEDLRASFHKTIGEFADSGLHEGDIQENYIGLIKQMLYEVAESMLSPDVYESVKSMIDRRLKPYVTHGILLATEDADFTPSGKFSRSNGKKRNRGLEAFIESKAFKLHECSSEDFETLITCVYNFVDGLVTMEVTLDHSNNSLKFWRLFGIKLLADIQHLLTMIISKDDELPDEIWDDKLDQEDVVDSIATQALNQIEELEQQPWFETTSETLQELFHDSITQFVDASLHKGNLQKNYISLIKDMLSNAASTMLSEDLSASVQAMIDTRFEPYITEEKIIGFYQTPTQQTAESIRRSQCLQRQNDQEDTSDIFKLAECEFVEFEPMVECVYKYVTALVTLETTLEQDEMSLIFWKPFGMKLFSDVKRLLIKVIVLEGELAGTKSNQTDELESIFTVALYQIQEFQSHPNYDIVSAEIQNYYHGQIREFVALGLNEGHFLENYMDLIGAMMYHLVDVMLDAESHDNVIDIVNKRLNLYVSKKKQESRRSAKKTRRNDLDDIIGPGVVHLAECQTEELDPMIECVADYVGALVILESMVDPNSRTSMFWRPLGVKLHTDMEHLMIKMINVEAIASLTGIDYNEETENIPMEETEEMNLETDLELEPEAEAEAETEPPMETETETEPEPEPEIETRELLRGKKLRNRSRPGSKKRRVGDMLRSASGYKVRGYFNTAPNNQNRLVKYRSSKQSRKPPVSS